MMKAFMDGNALCIVDEPFTNIMECDAEFHDEDSLTYRYIAQLEADNERLRDAHQGQFEDSGYCLVCGEHTHTKDCPADALKEGE